MSFCDRVLATTDDLAVQSDALWTLCNVARRAGLHERALAAAQRKSQVDKGRGNDHEIALAAGAIADIFQARGDLDEALRIRRDEELPVYDRLGDVRSILVCRANIALLLLSRNRPEDRTEAADLLRLALRAAEAMGIPEAAQIRAFQSNYNLT
jgi:hypothetical protein